MLRRQSPAGRDGPVLQDWNSAGETIEIHAFVRSRQISRAKQLLWGSYRKPFVVPDGV
jgi:hypothetical protein